MKRNIVITCVLTLEFILLGIFVFKVSYLRFFESVLDLFSSIQFFFCKVLKIETQISPELQKDGGDIALIDIQDNKVFVKLQGKCSSCKNATLTIKRFVEQTLRTAMDEDIEVIEA